MYSFFTVQHYNKCKKCTCRSSSKESVDTFRKASLTEVTPTTAN